MTAAAPRTAPDPARVAVPAAAIPRLCTLRGVLRLREPCDLPAHPGSEVRGLLTQGLARIGRWSGDGAAPFTAAPGWLGPTHAPARLVACDAGHEISVRLVWFGPEADPTSIIEAAYAAIGWQPLLGRRRRARFDAEFRLELPAAAVPAHLARRVRELSSRATGDRVPRGFAEGETPESYRGYVEDVEPEQSPVGCGIAARSRHTHPLFGLNARSATLAGGPITLRTLTPLALRRHGEMLTDFTDPDALLTTIRHRADRLADAFGALDLPPLTADATLDAIADGMAPIRYRRRGRKDRYIQLEAMHGTATFAPPAPDALRALVVGELLGVGRWTAFGAGRYALTGGRVEGMR